MKLNELQVSSFVTDAENFPAVTVKGGGGPVKTIASMPVTDCRPVPTTDLVWTGGYTC